MKSQILQHILQVVSDYCETSAETICSKCKPTEVLYARTLFVWFSHQYGICANDIARFLNRKHTETIYAYLANYHIYKRSSATFRLINQYIANKLSATLQEP